MRLVDRCNASDTIRARIIGIGLVAIALIVATRASAQDVTAQVVGRPSAMRAQLDSSAADAERLALKESLSATDRMAFRLSAAAMRRRLAEGDFEVGDQIVLQVEGQDSLSGTFVIREGRVLVLPTLTEIPVRGLLRAEIQPYLIEQIGRYVRNPRVRVTALLRVAVLGEVRNPGFYRVAADLPLSEALMAAGGPTSRAELRSTSLRHDGREVVSAPLVRNALASGATLDQLGLRGGDEILVGAHRGVSWQTVLQTVTAVVSVSALLLIRQR